MCVEGVLRKCLPKDRYTEHSLPSQVEVEDVTTSESFCLRRAQAPPPDLEHRLLRSTNVCWPGESLSDKWLQPSRC